MWRDLTTDAFDWTLTSGSTPSSQTGPSGAKSGTRYLYIETSGGSAGDTAIIGTAPLLISPGTILTFAYHMYGSSMGKLAVKVGSDEVWSKEGDQGNAWNMATVDLSSKAGQTLSVEFIGVRGSSYRGDAAIDDVTFSKATMAPSPMPSAAPTQEPTLDVAKLFDEYDVDGDGVLKLNEFKMVVEKLGVAANLLQPSSASQETGTRRLRGLGQEGSGFDDEESYTPMKFNEFKIVVEKLGAAASLLQRSSASQETGTRRLRGLGQEDSGSDDKEGYSPLRVFFVFLINGALSSFFMIRKIACWPRSV